MDKRRQPACFYNANGGLSCSNSDITNWKPAQEPEYIDTKNKLNYHPCPSTYESTPAFINYSSTQQPQNARCYLKN